MKKFSEGGCVRQQRTMMTLNNGRQMPVTVFHALFKNERAAFETREQAEKWIEKRTAVWLETGKKTDERRAFNCATRVAERTIREALGKCNELTDAERAIFEFLANEIKTHRGDMS